MPGKTVRLVAAFLIVITPGSLWAAASAIDPVAIDRLVAEVGPATRVELHRATGAARFVTLPPGGPRLPGETPQARAHTFLDRHGRIFGIRDVESELGAPTTRDDHYGWTHLTYRQRYRGLPVFAGTLRAHFDPAGRLGSVNGTFVPDVDLDPTPLKTQDEAIAAAIAEVGVRLGVPAAELDARVDSLMIFRAGLARGTAGADHLVRRIEVTSGSSVREWLFVDARDGRVVEMITGIHTVLDRQVHEGDYNELILWNEGDTLPYDTGDATNDGQVNSLIDHASDVFNLFANLSGGAFLSWDGQSETMHSVWEATTIPCPNASWNGTTTNYCNGAASDDVIAHEWAHAYTESTHALIYQWQPGALNESYSDIFGEIVDLTDGAGTDSPGGTRVSGDCSSFGGSPPPELQVTAPAALAGTFAVSGAGFNPPAPQNAAGPVALVNDGSGNTADGCDPFVLFPAGRIALVDRGSCSFTSKVANAEAAGAIGMIVANNTQGTFTMGGGGTAGIPSVMISLDDGDALKAELPNGVDATITLADANADTVRWLVGEDAFGFGGAIRDMWNPVCFGHPGKVSDAQYRCGTGDAGGVHSNSGVPNHAFALLLDGGSYNGRTVLPIGLVKAANVYWRAMSVYQVESSDFADHASALAQSCEDLIGVNLPDPSSGAPSGESLSLTDCDQIDEAAAAVELLVEPDCNFSPLLDPSAPPLACGTAVFSESFDSDPTAAWTLTNSGPFAEYVARDWAWTSDIPTGGGAPALYALNDRFLGNCIEGDDDQSGVMSAETPPIVLSADPTVSFRHYVATEPEVDGGNLEISVNGAPYELIAAEEFLFNPYNTTLRTAEQENTNPMAGEPAFAGTDGGVVFGSWGESQISLAAYASPGDTVRLRFDFGVDGCNGLDGWYVDDIVVCSSVASAGRIPDGNVVPGAPLLLDKVGGEQVSLSWGDSCHVADTDYAVYEGTLGGFTSHTSRVCSTAGQTNRTLTPAVASSYYLIVPQHAGVEGSYGSSSVGAERAVSAAACAPQATAGGCVP